MNYMYLRSLVNTFQPVVCVGPLSACTSSISRHFLRKISKNITKYIFQSQVEHKTQVKNIISS